MSQNTTIRELMHEADNLMVADEPVKNARPQFELETARSLILVDETGPIGLLTRSRMRNIPEEEMNRPARDFSMPAPFLLHSQTLGEARRELSLPEFEIDRIPVINDDGRLVGVIDRDVLQRESDAVVMDQGMFKIAHNDAVFPIQTGMNVLGSDSGKLGKIDRIVVEHDAAVSFTVEHGLFGRRHKHVGAEHVTASDEENIYLNFGKREFGFLADIEDSEASPLPTASA